MPGKLKYCEGCDNDFYNGHNPMEIKECWSLKETKVTQKWCIGWWTPMDNKNNFQQVTTNSCHTETSKRAFLDKLPSHLA